MKKFAVSKKTMLIIAGAVAIVAIGVGVGVGVGVGGQNSPSNQISNNVPETPDTGTGTPDTGTGTPDTRPYNGTATKSDTGDLTISDGVTDITGDIYNNDPTITSIRIGSNVNTIAAGSFTNDVNLMTVFISKALLNTLLGVSDYETANEREKTQGYQRLSAIFGNQEITFTVSDGTTTAEFVKSEINAFGKAFIVDGRTEISFNDGATAITQDLYKSSDINYRLAITNIYFPSSVTTVAANFVDHQVSSVFLSPQLLNSIVGFDITGSLTPEQTAEANSKLSEIFSFRNEVTFNSNEGGGVLWTKPVSLTRIIGVGVFTFSTNTLTIPLVPVGQQITLSGTTYSRATHGEDIQILEIANYEGRLDDITIEVGAFIDNSGLRIVRGPNGGMATLLNKLIRAGGSTVVPNYEGDGRTVLAPFNRYISAYFGNQLLTFRDRISGFLKAIYTPPTPTPAT